MSPKGSGVRGTIQNQVNTYCGCRKKLHSLNAKLQKLYGPSGITTNADDDDRR